MLESSLGGDEYTAKVQINDLVHLLQRRFFEWLGNGCTCVVHQDIELAESLDGHFDCILDGLRIGSVSPKGVCLSTGCFNALNDRGGRIGILGVGDRHLSPVRSETFGDGSTNSA